MHGWGIMQRLRLLTDGVFQVTPGSLFPALQRLEDQGWTSSSWDISENNRRAKYYAITKSGRKQLAREEASWTVITSAVTKVLQEG
jgi:transcriptional regulator